MNGLAGPSADAGTNVKSASLKVTGLAVGTTTLTIMTMQGSNPCPPAVHTYTIEVAANVGGMLLAFDKRAKDEVKEFKLEAKLEYTAFKGDLKLLGTQYTKDNTLDANGYIEGVFDRFTTGMSNLWMRSWEASWDVSNFGSSLLSGNAVENGTSPGSMFSGSCGILDTFDAKLYGEFGKTFSSMNRDAKAALGLALKKDNLQAHFDAQIVEISTRSPLYANQSSIASLGVPTSIMALAGIPATGQAANNGFVLAGGIADGGTGRTFEVRLIKTVNGQPDISEELHPTISNNYWSAKFTDLTPEHWRLRAGFQDDVAYDEQLVYVPKR